MTPPHKAITSHRDWRPALLAAIALYWCAVLFVPGHILPAVTHQTLLQALGVAALSDWFVDLYGISAWFELAHTGQDPAHVSVIINLPSGQTVPSCLMNYPRAVFAFDLLGLSKTTIPSWGIGMALAFFTLLLLWLGPLTPRRAFLAALFAIAPPTTLLIERANLDLLLLSLLLAAGALITLPAIPQILVLAGGILKIFPIVALSGTLRPGSKQLPYTAAAAALFATYLVLIRSELASLSSGLQNATSTGFGTGVISNLLSLHGVLPPAWASQARQLEILAALLLGAAATATAFPLPAHSNPSSPHSLSEKQLFGLNSAAAIFCASFLFGPQMDYKWAFLLLALPGIFTLLETPNPALRRLAQLWLLAALLYAWWTFFSNETSPRNALLKASLAWVLYTANTLLLALFFLRPWAKTLWVIFSQKLHRPAKHPNRHQPS